MAEAELNLAQAAVVSVWWSQPAGDALALARWASKPGLSAHQHAQRGALKRAVHVLQDKAFAHGCELRARGAEGKR